MPFWPQDPGQDNKVKKCTPEKDIDGSVRPTGKGGGDGAVLHAFYVAWNSYYDEKDEASKGVVNIKYKQKKSK